MGFNRNKYNKNYKNNNYDTLTVYLPKGEKDRLRQSAYNAGLSLNKYIAEKLCPKSKIVELLEDQAKHANSAKKSKSAECEEDEKLPWE